MTLATFSVSPDVQLAIAGILIGAVIGYFVGLRTNFIIGRIFEYRAFLHQALFEVRLMSGRMRKDSSDYTRVPRADHAVRLFADQIETVGQVEVSTALRAVAKQMEEKFDACRSHESDIDFHAEKAVWVDSLADLRPKWSPFFKKKKRA